MREVPEVVDDVALSLVVDDDEEMLVIIEDDDEDDATVDVEIDDADSCEEEEEVTEVLVDCVGLVEAKDVDVDVEVRELDVDNDTVTDRYISILRLPPQYSVAFDLQVNVQPRALGIASVARELPQ